MLTEMEHELTRRRAGGVLVFGDSTACNPDLYYCVRADLPRGGIYVKKLDAHPILVVSDIDLDNAEKSIVKRLGTYSDYGYEKIAREHGPDRAFPLLCDRILHTHQVQGKVVISGKNEVSSALNLVDELRRLGHRIVGETHPTLFESLRETKEQSEIDRIAEVGRKTERTIAKTIEWLKDSRRLGAKLYWKSKRVTIGLLKSYVRTMLAEQNLLPLGSPIFSVGSDSAHPHRSGFDSDFVLVDRPIIFDLFTQGSEGYCFDTTRSFVVGTPPEKIRDMYSAVLEAQNLALDNITAGAKCGEVMSQVCDFFKKRGYETMRGAVDGNKRAVNSGFTHSLGHGVGLTIGERPFLTLFNRNRLKSRSVVTVEPGLYHPRVGGVRLEDVIVVSKSGARSLSKLSKALVL